MPTGHGGRTPWTRHERAILTRHYLTMDIDAVAAMLPGRTVTAIRQQALKIPAINAADTARPPAGLRQSLAPDQLETALRLFDQRHSYAEIARSLGLKTCTVTNAILMARCQRAGFTPAKRDAAGGLLASEVHRLYDLLRRGLKGVEIQLRMGISASCVCNYRRRAKAEGIELPPPGGGVPYSGRKLSRETMAEIDRLLLEGFGAPKVAETTGASKTQVLRRRRSLIQRLSHKGECLPGCDIDGRRLVVRASYHFIPEQAKVDLRWRLLDRWPVARAARDLGIGASSAYKIRDELVLELAAQGKVLPPPRRDAKRTEGKKALRKIEWLPPEKRRQYRKLTHQLGAEEAKRFILGKSVLAAPAAIAPPPGPDQLPRAVPPFRRALSFEEQLARVAAGAGLVEVIPLRRPDPAGTLGGVASGML